MSHKQQAGDRHPYDKQAIDTFRYSSVGRVGWFDTPQNDYVFSDTD